MLQASALTVAVGGRTLVRDLTFNLAAGDRVCLLGPNAVGKTLLLHTLAGLRRPGAGSVALDGRDMRDLGRQDIARYLGLLLQDDAETFPATVLGTVLMGRHPHLEPLARESAADLAIATDALRAVDLVAEAGRPVKTLSGGERRRLAFARLLAQDPRVMLLDEPVNHLDPRHQISVLRQVRDLAAAGRGIIMTLHDPALAMRFASQALLLFSDGSWVLGRCGEVLTAASLERLFGTPHETFRNDSGVAVFLPQA